MDGGREIMLLEVVVAYFKISENLCEGTQDNKVNCDN